MWLHATFRCNLALLQTKEVQNDLQWRQWLTYLQMWSAGSLPMLSSPILLQLVAECVLSSLWVQVGDLLFTPLIPKLDDWYASSSSQDRRQLHAPTTIIFATLQLNQLQELFSAQCPGDFANGVGTLFPPQLVSFVASGGAIATMYASTRIAHLYFAVTGAPETSSSQSFLCASLVESATLTKQWVIIIAHVITNHFKFVLSARVHAMEAALIPRPRSS